MEIDVELLGVEKDAKVKIENVLLISKDDEVTVGTPYVKGASVDCEVVDNIKDKKVISFKYKNKVNYHKTIGHRQKYTRLKVANINA